eukprot:5417912-Amphidinium_carterae.2
MSSNCATTGGGYLSVNRCGVLDYKLVDCMLIVPEYKLVDCNVRDVSQDDLAEIADCCIVMNTPLSLIVGHTV